MPLIPDYRSTPFRAPRGASVIGMWLTLASLTMLFVAGMMLYVLIRLKLAGHAVSAPLHLPGLTWLSTLILIAGSVSIHFAIEKVRFEKQAGLRFYLGVTAVLAVLFLVVQTPCMIELLREHEQLQSQGIGVYGTVFFLVLLHAVHVIGGVIVLGVVNVRAHLGKYDHENYMGVRNAAIYWHFLDVIWLIMFTMFWLTR